MPSRNWHRQQTPPARKQVMPHTLTVFVSPGCFESFTLLPHVIPAFSSLPLTFQPASHLPEKHVYQPALKHWCILSPVTNALLQVFGQRIKSPPGLQNAACRCEWEKGGGGGNMGNAVSFTPSNWSAPIQRDYKQLKQAVTLQTIKYLIKPQHERAFGRGKSFLMCTHSLKKPIYLVLHWGKEGRKRRKSLSWLLAFFQGRWPAKFNKSHRS